MQSGQEEYEEMTVVHEGALHDVLESRDLVPSLNWFVGGFLNGDFSDTETSGTISKVWYATLESGTSGSSHLFFFNVHLKLWNKQRVTRGLG